MFSKLVLISVIAVASNAFSVDFSGTQGFLQRQATCVAGVVSAQALSLPGPIGGIIAGVCYDQTELVGDKHQYKRLDSIINGGIPTVDLSTFTEGDVVEFLAQARLDADPVSSVQAEVGGIFRGESEAVLKVLIKTVFESLGVDGMNAARVDDVISVLKLV